MSTIDVITTESAVSNISQCYHPVLKVMCSEYIQPTEKLVFVAECTRHEIKTRDELSVGKMIRQEYDITKEVEYVKNLASIVVLTDKRWLRMSLREFEYSRYIRISNHKSFLGRWFAGEKRKFEWYFAPKELPIPKTKLTPNQYIASQIKLALLPEIVKQVTGQSEYTLEDRHVSPPSEIHLFRLQLGPLLSYSFRQSDGVRIRQLLQLASINNGYIPLTPKDTNTTQSKASSVDHLEKLRQLKLMLDDGLITHQEFQIKKQELLLRM